MDGLMDEWMDLTMDRRAFAVVSRSRMDVGVGKGRKEGEGEGKQ
jgi:hypothetical protein